MKWVWPMISLGTMEKKEKQQTTRNFGSLQWRDEVATVAKRRKIEDLRSDELQQKKKKAIEQAHVGGGGDKADEEPVTRVKLKRIYTDVQTPRKILASGVGMFEFSVIALLHVTCFI